MLLRLSCQPKSTNSLHAGISFIPQVLSQASRFLHCLCSVNSLLCKPSQLNHWQAFSLCLLATTRFRLYVEWIVRRSAFPTHMVLLDRPQAFTCQITDEGLNWARLFHYANQVAQRICSCLKTIDIPCRNGHIGFVVMHEETNIA